MKTIRIMPLLSYTMLSFLLVIQLSCSEDDGIEPSKDIEAPIINSRTAFINEIEIKWSTVSDAVNYEIDLALDNDFNQILSDYSSITKIEPELRIENLKPTTTYFIRVRAVSSLGEKSKYSTIAEISTLEYKVCDNSTSYEFLEEDGVVKVEFEDAEFGDGWELRSDNDLATGQGYMVWTLGDNFSKPSDDLAIFKLRISTPGTYKFVWYSAVTAGESGTEHNDTWMRFPDAEDYYAKKDTAIVYPKGSGKTPNPEGASTDGWFKIYRSGNDLDFKWQSRTSDRDPHEIYVEFGTSRTYTMEISARSNGHGIDKFVLYLESHNQTSITDDAEFSQINCL